MGGLVGDMASYVEHFDPGEAAPGFALYWAGVSATTGMPHPATLRWMYRSTEPACVAVEAAAQQGDEIAERVLRRLREATFVFGEPPDTVDRILAAVRRLVGLDVTRLERDMAGDAAWAAFRSDWAETRSPDPSVLTLEDEGEGGGRAKYSEGRWRYVFPTLVFAGWAGRVIVPGWKPYERYAEAIEAVAPGATASPRPDPTPAQAFAAWPTLARHELELLCGIGARPPEDIVGYDLGTETYWLTAAEARALGL
jgi:thioredoxin family protein